MKSRYRLLATALIGLAVSSVAWSLPEGGKVVNGQVKVNGQGNVLEILQSSPQAIVNWNSFNINVGEIVRFLQPSTAAAILNRVVGQDPSRILGMLQANGKVFLVNPNGILFGPGSVVDAGSFMASTLSISDQDFLNNKFHLVQDPNQALAAIVNQGTIRVTDGGFVALVSPLISHEGLIVANSGQVALGATREATLNFDGRGLMEMVIPDGFNRNTLQNAPGPKSPVLMTQDQVGDVLSSVINTKSFVEAGAIVKQGNNVQLVGGEGVLLATGKIATDGQAGANGGRIQLDSSQATLLSDSGKLSSTGANSNGGTINVLSAGKVVTAGAIDVSATGAGNGGFVEISGHDVSLGAIPNLASQTGTAGIFLLDPNNIFIINGTATLDGQLPNVNFTNATQDGSISLAALQNSTGTVTLNATANITSNVDLTINNPINLSMTAGNNIQLLNVTIDSPGAASSLILNAAGTIGTNALLVRGTGAKIDITAGRNLNVGSATADAGATGVGVVNLKSSGANLQVPFGISASTGVNVSTTGTAFIGNTIEINPAQAPTVGSINVSASQLFGRNSTPGNIEMFVNNASSLRFNITGANASFSTPPAAARINVVGIGLQPVTTNRVNAPVTVTNNTLPTGDIYLNGAIVPRTVTTPTTTTPSTSPSSSPSPGVPSQGNAVLSLPVSAAAAASSGQSPLSVQPLVSGSQSSSTSSQSSSTPLGSQIQIPIPYNPNTQGSNSSSSSSPGVPSSKPPTQTLVPSESVEVIRADRRGELRQEFEREIEREVSQGNLALGYKIPSFRRKNLLTRMSHRDDSLFDFNTFQSVTVEGCVVYGTPPDQLEGVLNSIETNLNLTSTLAGEDLNFWRKLIEGIIIWQDDEEEEAPKS